jgi:hypothetical protein
VPPVPVFVRTQLMTVPRSIEQVAEKIASVRGTSIQRPSCGGRGWRCENSKRNAASPPVLASNPSLKERDGKSPNRFVMPSM